jgi:hypothetical protein
MSAPDPPQTIEGISVASLSAGRSLPARRTGQLVTDKLEDGDSARLAGTVRLQLRSVIQQDLSLLSVVVCYTEGASAIHRYKVSA